MHHPPGHLAAVDDRRNLARPATYITFLAIISAALLVFAACSASDKIESTTDSRTAQLQESATANGRTARDSSDNNDDTSLDEEDASDATSPDSAIGSSDDIKTSVLIVANTIEQGTPIEALLEAPTLWLMPQAVPSDTVGSTAFTAIAELQDLSGVVAYRDLLPGERLDRSFFKALGAYDADGCFLGTIVDTDLDVLTDNAQVLVLTEPIAAGFPISSLIEEADFYVTSFRVGADQLCADPISEVGNLEDMLGLQANLDIPAGSALYTSQFGS